MARYFVAIDIIQSLKAKINIFGEIKSFKNDYREMLLFE